MKVLKKIEGIDVKIKQEQVVDASTQSKRIVFTRDASASSGDVSYTGVGFKPTSLQAVMAVSGTLYHSVGFSDENKNCSSVFQASASAFYANSSYFILHSNQGSWVQGASVKSYDNDGFTLTWSKVGSPTAGTMDIKVICYK